MAGEEDTATPSILEESVPAIKNESGADPVAPTEPPADLVPVMTDGGRLFSTGHFMGALASAASNKDESIPAEEKYSGTEPVGEPTKRTNKATADGLPRMTSIGRLFSSGDSFRVPLLASSDAKLDFYKSNGSFQSIGSIGTLPSLDMVSEGVTATQVSVGGAHGKATVGTSWGDGKYVRELMQSQDPAIQKMLQSISRAAQTVNTVLTDEGKNESSSNQKSAIAGIFTSGNWGSELGPIQDDDIKNVFSTSEGKAEKFQKASRAEKPLAQQNPPAATTATAQAAPTKNRLPKKKRDWNEQVIQDLNACLDPTQRPPNCATPADAAILAAAAANFGKCGSNPVAVKEVKKTRPPKKRGERGLSPSSGDTPVVEPQPPMEPDDMAGRGQEDEGGIFVEPTDSDVLLGRGGRTNNHPGNKKYLEAKDAMQARYMAADKNAKTPISQELVDIVKNWGGRFLKMNGAGKWYTIDDSTARKKCSQSLREVNTPEERAAKRARYVNK